MSNGVEYELPEVYLPHRAPMLLVDRVELINDHEVRVSVSSCPRGTLWPLQDEDGHLSSAYLIEMMAQSIGVWAGYQRKAKEKAARLSEEAQEEALAEIGLLLSVRQAHFMTRAVPLNAHFEVRMNKLIQDGRLASFEGGVYHGETLLSQGKVTVYQPSVSELDTLFSS